MKGASGPPMFVALSAIGRHSGLARTSLVQDELGGKPGLWAGEMGAPPDNVARWSGK